MLQNGNEFVNKQVQVWLQGYVKTTFGVDTAFNENPAGAVVDALEANNLKLAQKDLVYTIVDTNNNVLSTFKPILTF